MVSKYGLSVKSGFYWSVHMGDYVCRNVAWLHLAWVGVFASTPWRGHTCTHAMGVTYVGLTWIGLKWWAWKYILYVDNGRMQHFDCTWWEGVWAAPRPSTESCTHIIICPHNIQSQFQNYNFKLQFHTYFEINFKVTFSDLCLCTQIATFTSNPQSATAMYTSPIQFFFERVTLSVKIIAATWNFQGTSQIHWKIFYVFKSFV